MPKLYIKKIVQYLIFSYYYFPYFDRTFKIWLPCLPHSYSLFPEMHFLSKKTIILYFDCTGSTISIQKNNKMFPKKNPISFYLWSKKSTQERKKREATDARKRLTEVWLVCSHACVFYYLFFIYVWI